MSVVYEVIGDLGRGGMGYVELVRDPATDEVFARKRLRRFDVARLRALKRELRLVGSLSHPNLVHVEKLGEDERGPYLLMEVVEGVDVVTHCRRDHGASELASILPQLLSVLAFLHRRGLSHGDLSPSNVLVRRDGCVKLLDFGLGAADGDRGPSGGTPGYTPPERRLGGAPTPQGDLYALGAILHHIVYGEPPSGHRARHGSGSALDAMIERLTSPEPRERPSLEALERALTPIIGSRGLDVETTRVDPLERSHLAAQVFGTILARPGGLVALRGPSGIGKTTLARRVAARAEGAGFGVTWARARPEETIPFNLFDELMDDVAQRLSPAREPAVEAAAMRAAVTFPALTCLGGGDPHADHVKRRVRAELFGETARPRASRTTLFSDVRALLEAVDPGTPRRLLVLDDLQWADEDSLALLASLLDASSPRLTFLATVRPHAGDELEPRIAAHPHVSFVEVPPLSIAEMSAHLERVLGFGAEAAVELASASEGLPALMALALRRPRSPQPLRDAVRSLVNDGEPAEKRLLASLLVMGQALEVDPRLTRRPVDRLVRRGLVVREGDRLSLLHDSLREPLREALGDDWIRVAHEARARELDARAGSEVERIRHLVGAGRSLEAARSAREAARGAVERNAFGLAVELHRVALAAGARPTREYAAALDLARRFEAAANVWGDLAEAAAPGDERAELLLAQAHSLLAGGRLAEGRARLTEALRECGVRGLELDRSRRLLTFARFLLGPAPRMPGGRRPSLPRAQRYLEIAALVGYFDTAQGLDLLLRARASFDGYDAERAARCEYLLSFFARFGMRRGTWLSRSYRRVARNRLRGIEPRSPIVRAFPRMLAAYDAQRECDFRTAVEGFDAALAEVLGTPDERSFEAQLTTSLRTSVVLATQNVDDAEAAVARFEALARDGVEVAIACHVENARALVCIWRGRFEEALEGMERLRSSWPTEPATIQSILIDVYTALPSVLLGRAAVARAGTRAAIARARQLDVLPSAYGPIIAGIAAITEIAARHEGGFDRAAARRWAALSASRPSVLTGLGHRALAALELLHGRRRRAVARLRLAEREAVALGQAIDAALARLSRGRLTGDLEAEIEARAMLAAAGASPRLLVEHELLFGAH